MARECESEQPPRELARYIVTVIEGAIMPSRAYRDSKLIARQLTALKEHPKKSSNRETHA